MSRILPLLLTTLLLLGCSTNPRNERAAESNTELGLNYMMRNNYDRALEKLNRALEYDPDSADAHHYLGELYRRRNQATESERHFRRALELTRYNPMLLNNFGVFLCEQRRPEEAKPLFEQILRDSHYRDRSQVYENLGLCYEKEPKVAENYFREAMNLNPRLPKSLLAMARITFTQQRTLSTRAYIQRLHEIEEPTAESLGLGIQVERQLGDAATQARYVEELLRRFPHSSEAQLYSGNGKHP